MTDRTRRALKTAARAAGWMAVLGALNGLFYGRQITTAFWSRVALVIVVSIASFLILGALFFPLAYVDESKTTEEFKLGRWTRPFTKAQAIAAYLIAGWLASLLIVGVGDYIVVHRLPTGSELETAMLVSVVFGPFIALVAAWFVARLRRAQRDFGRGDSEPA